MTKILIADDDTDVLREVGIFLRKQGFEVVCAEDGYQALEMAVRETPDLLVLDVHMPAGDGFSVQERVARHAELALSPVIYMTRDPSIEIESGRSHGGFTVLHKPLELEHLLDAVEAALRSAGADAA